MFGQLVTCTLRAPANLSPGVKEVTSLIQLSSQFLHLVHDVMRRA